eukprot:sb/3462435/
MGDSLADAVAELQRVLRLDYNFTGSLETTQFSSTTSRSFSELAGVLKAAAEQGYDVKEENTTPVVGDEAYVYWAGCGWYTAIIRAWMPSELAFMIKWTDGDWAAERAELANICLNKVPSVSSVGVGTRVLFKQGLYYCGRNDDGTVCDSTGRALSDAKKAELAALGQISDRWHMGQITRVYRDEHGEPRYNGEHVPLDDPQASRPGFVGYERVFTDLKLPDLRITPNVFNCMDNSGEKSETTAATSCDVFVSKVTKDNKDISKLVTPLQGVYKVGKSADGAPSSSKIQSTVQQIKNCSVYLVCLSDNFIEDDTAMAELLYAKKTARKTVIPVVLGSSNKWHGTTAGMLLAGQLYIQIGNDAEWGPKTAELMGNLKQQVKQQSSDQGENSKPPRVFLSYCWSNSQLALQAKQISWLSGDEFSDPRRIKKDIEERLGERVWLDIEQLNSIDDSGMFGQLAEAVKKSSLVVMCISKEYTNSQNCMMEANFALRSLQKPVVVVEVGSGTQEDRHAWKQSCLGMLLPKDKEPVSITGVATLAAYEASIGRVVEFIKPQLPATTSAGSEIPVTVAPQPQQVAGKSMMQKMVPMLGDAVVAHYAAWQFFPAKVAEFNRSTLRYTVNWDDPDPSCRVQPYNLVAMNAEPSNELIGIGSRVLFKQGTYRFGDSTGDVWNLGEITGIQEVGGEKLYSGKHSKSAADGLAVASWPSFSPTFTGAKCSDLRLFPNAIEMLEQYRLMNEE